MTREELKEQDMIIEELLFPKEEFKCPIKRDVMINDILDHYNGLNDSDLYHSWIVISGTHIRFI